MTNWSDDPKSARYDLPGAMSRSAEVSDRFQELLGDTAHVDRRGAIATALLSICLDHRAAVLLLIEAGAKTSAMALGRSALEAYVTALWAERLATDVELDSFMKGRPPPSYERISQRLRKAHEFGELFEKLRAHYSTLSDYAHGYSRQVSRWIGPDGVGPRHVDEEMVELLRFVDAIGVLACIGREHLAQRPLDALHRLLQAVLHGAPLVETLPMPPEAYLGW